MGFKKNTIHQYIYFVMIKAADGTALTGASPTGIRSIDGGTYNAVTGTISEVATSGGMYKLDTSAADTNGTNIGFIFAASTAIPVCICVVCDSNIDQTGDSYLIVSNGTYGNSALHTEVAKDATVSKPGTAQTITAPYTVAQIADAIWDEVQSGHTTAGTFGLYVDAAISSRSTYAGGAMPPTASAISAQVWTDKPTIGTSTLTTSDVQTAMTSQGYTTTRAGYLDTLNGIVAAIWGYTTRILTAFSFKPAVTLDWSADVTNKPTIGTSTLTTSDVDARLTAFPVQKSNVAVTAPANMALDSTVAKSATALTNATWTDAKAALIDASIASRNATAPPSASDNATLVASTLASAHGAGSWTTATGFATPTDLGLLASYGDSHWSTATGFALASVWTPTKAGYLDAAISSRSTYSGGSVDFSPVTNYLNGTTPINAASLVNVPSVAMSDADKAALAASIAGDIPPPDLTGISTTLGQIKNKTDQITSGNFTITNAVSANGKQLFLNVGNAYTIANGHQLTWHGVFPADIAGATLKIWSDGDFSGIVVQATSVSPTAVTFELTAAQTNSLTACLRPTYHFALWDDQEFTEITGLVTVTRVQ